jgi:galactonate dehydratase
MSSQNRRSFFQSAGAGMAGLFGIEALDAAVQQNSTVYTRPKLRITDVRTAQIQGFHVRLMTDEGLIGEGEAVDAVSGAEGIVQGMGRSLVGQSPLNIEAMWERIRTSGVFAGAQGGQYVTGLTALEIALWDLAGKALGIPIYQLMGGKVRDRVRLYMDCADPSEPTFKDEMAKITDNGFTMTKIDIDAAGDPARWDRVNWTANNAEIDHMVAKVKTMKDMLPKGVELAVDMHGRYDVGTGKRVAKELEPFRLVWLEEPVPADNVDAMADIRHSTNTPICCGENIYMRWGFRPLFEKHAVDIIMPDIQKCGGLMEGKKIADMAHTYFVPIAPHSQASPIAAMATAHAMSTTPNHLVTEWHWGHPDSRYQVWKQFVTEGNIIEKGHIVPPDKPGIGVTLNEEFLKARPGTRWFDQSPSMAGGGRGFSGGGRGPGGAAPGGAPGGAAPGGAAPAGRGPGGHAPTGAPAGAPAGRGGRG